MKMEIGRIKRYIQSAMVIPRYPKPETPIIPASRAAKLNRGLAEG